MLGDAWRIATHEHGDPSRPVVLRTTLLPTGDVLLAVDRGWWREASARDRRALLAAHRAAVAIRLAQHRRIAALASLSGAAAGAGIAWATGVPPLAVMPVMALAGWAAARLARLEIARRLRVGLSGTLSA